MYISISLYIYILYAYRRQASRWQRLVDVVNLAQEQSALALERACFKGPTPALDTRIGLRKYKYQQEAHSLEG